MTIKKEYWPKIELLFFTFITLANLVPFISTKFFPSLDGASHLSNANIINQIVIYHNELFRQFFQINPEPVPNWTSHLLLAILGLVIPAFLAEKIIIAGLLIGIPFAFRGLMKILKPENISISYLIFPFTHSMFLFFGFFNFCIGVLFLMITLRYWLLKQDNMKGLKDFLILVCFIFITYFSHIVVFGILLILVAIQIIARNFSGFLNNKTTRPAVIRDFFRQVITIVLASIIPLLLFVYFFISRPGTRNISFLPKAQLLEFLYQIRPLISFNAYKEGSFTLIFFCLLVGLVISGLLILVFRQFKSQAGSSNTNSQWLLPSVIILLFLYFILPDAYGTASYTNLRLGFLFFLLVILWISILPLPKWAGILAAAIAIVINVIMIEFNKPILKEFDQMVKASNKAAEFIPPNSLVLPIYVMDNWFTGHFVDYLAIDKPILMVYNYECETGYFPVKWNKSAKPNYYIGNLSDTAHYINFELIKGRESLKVNYIYILGQYNPEENWFFRKLDNILHSSYTPVYSKDNFCLYQAVSTY